MLWTHVMLEREANSTSIGCENPSKLSAAVDVLEPAPKPVKSIGMEINCEIYRGFIKNI